MTHVRRVAALAAACTFILPASAQAAGYADDVLADGPLTYLRLGEIAGTVAQDAPANDRDGAYAGDVTLGAAGPFSEAGTAVQLAKTGGVGVPVPAASRSLELWVNPNRLRRGEGGRPRSHGDPAGDGWAFGVGTKRKLAWVSGGTRAQSKVSLPTGVWSQLTVTWSAAKVLIYLNGHLAKSVNTPGGLARVQLGRRDARRQRRRRVHRRRFAGRSTRSRSSRTSSPPRRSTTRFVAANVPVNTAPPAITGPARVGRTLTVRPATWTNVGRRRGRVPVAALRRRGRRLRDVDGATATTFALTAGDACSTFQVAETRTNATGAATAVSAPYGPVTGTMPRHGPGHRSRRRDPADRPGDRPRHRSGP